MPRLTLPILATSLLLLSACGSVKSSYEVSFERAEGERVEYLKEAVVRVIQGRMANLQKKLKSSEYSESNGKTILTLNVSDQEAADILREQLTTPFTIRIMTEVPAGQGDVHSEKHGDYAETGLTEEHFDWVDAAPTDGGKGTATLHFTDEGKQRLKDIFTQNRGKVIGIFVRDQLMSKKLIEAGDTQESIAIDNIPSSDIATIFADDVNVGLHVRFAAPQ